MNEYYQCTAYDESIEVCREGCASITKLGSGWDSGAYPCPYNQGAWVRFEKMPPEQVARFRLLGKIH